LKNFSWRALTIFAVIIIAVVYVLPTFYNNCWPHKKINLGLDLQGGMHLVLEVETEKAVESTMERIVHEMKTLLRKQRIVVKKLATTGNKTGQYRITVTIEGEKATDKFNNILNDDFQNLLVISNDKEGDITVMVLDLPESEKKYIKKMATDQALETIRNRIDEFGVSEPDIRVQGSNRILIQLPGIKDTKRAKALIGKTARLDFKLVDDTHDLQTALNKTVPPGCEILYQVKRDTETNRDIKTPFLLRKRTLLDGSSLTNAIVKIDSQYNEPYVFIEFDKKGGRIFAKITGENIKKRLAIVLDKTVYSAPVIQDRISGGSARITGNFTMAEARDLAIILRAGALPAPVKIIEERTVGPTLGADSIRKGLFSMLVGGVLVILFMVIYYNGAGLIADIALVINILLIAAGLAAFQATLTLPGIAGIILTIGMAVDANVLIFERIREEINAGKTPRASVEAGFDRATLTILDANVTTLIVAIVLFQFGTGPVKGFAVTLGLGIIASLFTSLFVAKSIFMFILTNWKIKKISI